MILIGPLREARGPRRVRGTNRLAQNPHQFSPARTANPKPQNRTRAKIHDTYRTDREHGCPPHRHQIAPADASSRGCADGLSRLGVAVKVSRSGGRIAPRSKVRLSVRNGAAFPVRVPGTARPGFLSQNFPLLRRGHQTCWRRLWATRHCGLRVGVGESPSPGQASGIAE